MPSEPASFSLKDHFRGRKAPLRKLFDELICKLKTDLEFEYKIGKSYIGLKHKLVFAALYIQTREIVVEFVARAVFKHPRIKKGIESGRNRWAYFVDVAASSDIDPQLLDWIKQSYE